METDRLAGPLLDWFGEHGRKDLPWQRDPSLYRIWVSEIMLQQTQVGVVIPYFARFLERFPTVKDLAEANAEDVMHLWSGLGYYARARNLHRAAGIVATRHGGHFPTEIEPLQALPGIGRSTAGAILSLALNQRHPILDGNAKRVLARYFAVSGWPGRSAVLKRLWDLADACTPVTRVAAYNQAMMDLGATLCTRTKPSCDRCPLAAGCKALAMGEPTAFPKPRPAKTLPVRETRMLLVRNPRGEVLLERRPPLGIWGRLWSFPECEAERDVADWCRQRLGVLPARVEKLPVRRHTFSHFHLEITPVQVFLAAEANQVRDGQARWLDPTRSSNLGLAAPIAAMLRELSASHTCNKGVSQ